MFICLLLLYSSTAFAQVQLVKGTVRDEKGPLPGVSILIKGKNTGTQTDAAGNFSIQAAKGDTLVISSTGYVAQRVAIDSRSVYNLTLTSDAKAMEDVVVIGYGTKKKQYLTGAVSTVGAEVFKSRPTASAMAALQGQVPGVTIQRESGQPGVEGYSLNVRGYSSTAGHGNSPLVLVDGVEGDLNHINPDDIESISTLKDAEASIYGARAAGGVMIVTTKKGRKGAPRINYNNNFAISKMTGMMQSPTNYQFAIMDNEANIHNGAAPMYTPEMLQKILNNDPNPIDHPLYGGWKLFFTNTDWLSALLENGFQQKHNLSISGGGTNSNYYLSAGYTDQRGVVKYANDNNKRYNLRLNYDYDFSKRLHLETNVGLENQQRTDLGGLGSWVITEAIFGMPNHPVYNKDGQFFAQGGWGNAVAQAKEAATATFNTRSLNSNFKLTADIVEGLKLNLQAGINYATENDRDPGKAIPLYNWDGDLAYYTVANPDQTWVTVSNAETIYKNFTGYLQYNKTFAGKHDLELMGGASHEDHSYDKFFAQRINMLNDQLWTLNLASGDQYVGEAANHNAINSLFSRLSYVFDKKYILEANVRYDGTSRFAPSERWGLFPGVSVGWRLSDENFIKDLGWFNDLKLRASYGVSGNEQFDYNSNYNTGADFYSYIQLINIGKLYPFGAGGLNQTASLDQMAATERTWERVLTKNIGLDASVLSSRLNFTFDYFNKTNNNILIPIALPQLLGAEPPLSNSGVLKTWGFETSVGWKDKVGKFDYSARLIVSDNQNKLVNLGGQDTYSLGLNLGRQGYPINTYFAYVFDGLIRNQKELDDYKKLGGVPSNIGIGDARFKDVNGDGKISLYGDQPGQDGDVVNVGTITPRYIFGLNLSARYGGFDVAVFLQGVGKRTLFREGDYAIPWSDWWRQPPAFYYLQTWNEDRPNAYYPRLSHGDIRYWNYQASTLQEVNGAYVRLKNLQIGYTIPQNLTRKISISQARIYFSGQDLGELSHVKGGWDPESATNGFNYPFQRLYSFGLDVNF
jgi:TonB-linked SusC/RagA family outer membrane protein